MIFYFYMLQNKQSHKHSLCNVNSHVAYRIMLNISTKKELEILSEKLYFEFKWFLQCNQENTGQNFVF